MEFPEFSKIPLQWSLDLWGKGKSEFSADDWQDFYDHASQGNYETWDPEGFDQELIFLALRDHEVVGAIALCDFDDLEEFRHLKPWIAAFIVDPKLRGSGVGSEILNLMEKKILAYGIKTIYLWSENRNNFYKNRGYLVIDQLTKPGAMEREIEIYRKILK